MITFLSSYATYSNSRDGGRDWEWLTRRGEGKLLCGVEGDKRSWYIILTGPLTATLHTLFVFISVRLGKLFITCYKWISWIPNYSPFIFKIQKCRSSWFSKNLIGKYFNTSHNLCWLWALIRENWIQFLINTKHSVRWVHTCIVRLLCFTLLSAD